ncbi:MAG: flippase [Tyzzerella sp.]|nr:flippase [Tyzzerella sp.]
MKSVKFNLIMNFILTASNFLFPLVTFPYVSRILGAAGNGKISFIASVASYFSMIAALGIPTYGIRACAAVRDDKEKLSKTAQELIFIHAFMTVVSLSFFFLAMFGVERLHQEEELMIINGISLFLNVLGVNWLYSALEQYQYITTRSIFFKIVSIFLMFALVHKEGDYILYGAITVFAAAGSNVLNFINLRKHIFLKTYKEYNLKQHIKPILVFFAQSVAITVYTNLDTVMLGFMKNDSEVGLYAAAVKVKNILTSLVTSLGTVLLPRLSYFIHNNRLDEFKKMIHTAVEFVLMISLPLTFYFVVMAEESILLLSGKGYVDATLAMQIIVPTIIFVGLSNVTGIQFLTPLNKERYVLYSVIVGAVVDLILNAIFIPGMGAAGAALGTLIAEISVLLVQMCFIKREFSYNIFVIDEILRVTIVNIISGLVLIILKCMIDLPVFWELVITCIMFFVVFLIACLWAKIQIVQDILRKILRRFSIR